MVSGLLKTEERREALEEIIDYVRENPMKIEERETIIEYRFFLEYCNINLIYRKDDDRPVFQISSKGIAYNEYTKGVSNHSDFLSSLYEGNENGLSSVELIVVGMPRLDGNAVVVFEPIRGHNMKDKPDKYDVKRYDALIAYARKEIEDHRNA